MLQLQVKRRNAKRGVEHESVQGDVYVSKDPGGDNEPDGTTILDIKNPAGCYGYVRRDGDHCEGEVDLDATVKLPHLTKTHADIQGVRSCDGLSEGRWGQQPRVALLI